MECPDAGTSVTPVTGQPPWWRLAIFFFLPNQRLQSYRCDTTEIFSSEEEGEEDGVLGGAEEGGDVEEGEDGGERLVCGKNQISKLLS